MTAQRAPGTADRSRALPRRPGPSVRVRVHEVQGATRRRREDRVATEEPLEVRVAWPGRGAHRVAVTMRSPGHDFELAAGFLHGEGVLPPGGLSTVAYCTDADLEPQEEFNVVTVTLAVPPVREPAPRYTGATAGSAACGVCGKDSVGEALSAAAVGGGSGPAWPDLRVGADLLGLLPERLREAQRVFSSTGGLHAAGLFTTDGDPVVVREDVGRHNAVDKVVGARLLAGRPPGEPLLCVSGRVGFELAQKAAAAGVGVIAGIGAPSSLAVDLARDAGLTLAGFVRRDRCVLYSAPERVVER